MSCYIISYDLRNQRNYDALYKAIKSYPSWAKILESTWAVVTSDSAEVVRDYLLRHIDGDDGLFVIKSARPAAWRGVNCKDSWLQENL